MTRKHVVAVGSLAVAVAVAVGACATAVVVPTASDVAVAARVYPDVTLHELSDGRALFVSRCAGCHQLPSPETRRPEEWPVVVDKMAPDAKISDSDRALIERYLVAASARSHAVNIAASR